MKLLICVGGLPYSVPTVRFGGLVARLASAKVVILNVIGREEEMTESEAVLALIYDMLDDLDPSTKTRLGDPATEILQESREGGYDLVVIGTRDVLSLAELFTGSIARKAVKRIRASVLVIRGGRTQLRRVLVCTNGRSEDQPTVEAAASLACRAGAEITLLHVAGSIPSMYRGLDAMDEQLTELLQSGTPLSQHLSRAKAAIDSLGLPAELLLRRGAVASEILREADLHGYDLIVMGASRGSRQGRGLLMVDVTRQVVDRARRPVFVVRRSGFLQTSDPCAHQTADSASDLEPLIDVEAKGP